MENEPGFKFEEFQVYSKDENLEKPFTIEELTDRIEKSEEDYEKGRFKTQEELEKLSEKW